MNDNLSIQKQLYYILLVILSFIIFGCAHPVNVKKFEKIHKITFSPKTEKREFKQLDITLNVNIKVHNTPAIGYDKLIEEKIIKGLIAKLTELNIFKEISHISGKDADLSLVFNFHFKHSATSDMQYLPLTYLTLFLYTPGTVKSNGEVNLKLSSHINKYREEKYFTDIGMGKTSSDILGSGDALALSIKDVSEKLLSKIIKYIAENYSKYEMVYLAKMNDKSFKKIAPEEKYQKVLSKTQKMDAEMTSVSRDFKFSNKSWAVVIGLSEYKYKTQNGLTNLIFADDDAKAFAHILNKLGWNESHIKLLINEEATERNIKIALESWLTKAGQNDQIVLYWAGHGFPDPEDPEKVYFACYDTDISIPATGYRMDKVRRALEERKSKNVILFADTCHAGKIITRGGRALSIVPNIEKMRREQKVPKGWIFMVGADTDRQAIEHTSWTNGAFTHSLIKGLSGAADGFQSAGAKDGVVTMGELKDYMNTAMPNETQKVLGVAKRPVITTSTGDPDIWNLTLQAR